MCRAWGLTGPSLASSSDDRGTQGWDQEWSLWIDLGTQGLEAWSLWIALGIQGLDGEQELGKALGTHSSEEKLDLWQREMGWRRRRLADLVRIPFNKLLYDMNETPYLGGPSIRK